MEIDQKPSALPGAALLLALLMFCLCVPLFWRSDSVTDEVATCDDCEEANGPGTIQCVPNNTLDMPAYLDWPLAMPGHAMPEHDLLQLWAAPTIEELIAARAWGVDNRDGSISWPVLHPTAPFTYETGRDKTAAIATFAPFLVVWECLERTIAVHPASEVLPWFAAKVTGAYQRLAQLAGNRPAPAMSAVASTLRLVRPDNSRAAAAEPSDPWCVPQVLIDQLEQLACHPQAADWAEGTLEQLRTLTQRERMDGDDVQSILAGLSNSAQEAARMAEDCDDDRLRVALLRAHWALARRLDAWGVLHDMRVASRAEQRLASRDSLGVYFDSAPAATDEQQDREELARQLEEYEQTNDPSLARQVAQVQRDLNSSPDSLNQALSETVEQHYRNANVRIAITGEFLNRFVAGERSDVRPLRDRIAGTPVRGTAQTHSESRVQLDPASGRWQFVVEAEGVVQSNTVADGGPAQLRSRSETDFTARKSVVIDPNGVQLDEAKVDASSRNRLVGVTTDFDWVPIFGSYARDRAMQEYRARRGRAQAEVELKVSTQAAHHIDSETLAAVEQAEQNIREQVTDRLATAGVEFTPIEMTTTPERIIGRFRVAGEHQLGSHTPRPRALSDSLASLQLHETALSNAAVSLGLENGRFTASELQAHFRERCPRLALRRSDSRDDVTFHFAAEDVATFHIDNGRLEMALAFTSVQFEDHRIRNFVIHAYYVPVVQGVEASLKRDGSLGIEGRLSSSDRARLHNIFNSVLAAERNLPLVKLKDPNDPRLDGLTITQFVLEDGWLGLAVGPGSRERVAERSRSLR